MSERDLASLFLFIFLLAGICCASAGKTGEALSAGALGLVCAGYLKLARRLT